MRRRRGSKLVDLAAVALGHHQEKVGVERLLDAALHLGDVLAQVAEVDAHLHRRTERLAQRIGHEGDATRKRLADSLRSDGGPTMDGFTLGSGLPFVRSFANFVSKNRPLPVRLDQPKRRFLQRRIGGRSFHRYNQTNSARISLLDLHVAAIASKDNCLIVAARRGGTHHEVNWRRDNPKTVFFRNLNTYSRRNDAMQALIAAGRRMHEAESHVDKRPDPHCQHRRQKKKERRRDRMLSNEGTG